jgi:hypothetical protein
MTLCRNKRGAIISGKEAILERWVENFDEILNIKSQNYMRAIIQIKSKKTEPVRKAAEVEVAIKKLKNKAPGIDLSQAELLKILGQSVINNYRNVWSMHRSIKRSRMDGI